ncbi:hypothetical protein FIBSPDRAFT_458676 [Athelia psychrophila]|uniref:Uncharacterized protein n=1 Tax=Athelia psychrophila TaxID=1759441 RepID=A0A167U9I8_9AGAM|nr:hypothetical protein FIBSPDRAFT_458676 [Fibularhizoctonia sp. CBS 109695]
MPPQQQQQPFLGHYRASLPSQREHKAPTSTQVTLVLRLLQLELRPRLPSLPPRRPDGPDPETLRIAADTISRDLSVAQVAQGTHVKSGADVCQGRYQISGYDRCTGRRGKARNASRQRRRRRRGGVKTVR